jgi:hypothetical protein
VKFSAIPTKSRTDREAESSGTSEDFMALP